MQAQVRANALTNYVQVARFVGLDPDKMLRRAGIDPVILDNPEHRLDALPVGKLLDDSARESGHPTFGLLMAEARSLANVGPLSLLLQHQSTVREALDTLVQYQGMLSDVIAIGVEEAGGTTIVAVGLTGGFGGRQSLELVMGLFCRGMGEIAGGRWRPDCAHFVHAAGADTGIYRRVFQCELAFEEEFYGFSCSTASLEAPNPAAESTMARNAQRYLDMLVPAPGEGPVTKRARRALYLLLPAERATVEQVGANLDMHPRTLQRLLVKEGRTFQALLNDVRRELAMRYLSGSTHNITSIALMTGYGTPSSFTRWFCAEFGISPAAWRAGERPEADQGLLAFGPEAAV